MEETTQKRGRGRPPRSDSNKKNHTLTVIMSPMEMESLNQAKIKLANSLNVELNTFGYRLVIKFLCEKYLQENKNSVTNLGM